MYQTETKFNQDLLSSNQASQIIEKNNFMLNKLSLSSIGITDIQKSLTNDDVLYFILPSKVNIEDTTYDTYGIGAIENNIVVDYILDLSTDYEDVKSFINLCNTNKLSLIHLKDAVENFLIA